MGRGLSQQDGGLGVRRAGACLACPNGSGRTYSAVATVGSVREISWPGESVLLISVRRNAFSFLKSISSISLVCLDPSKMSAFRSLAAVLCWVALAAATDGAESRHRPPALHGRAAAHEGGYFVYTYVACCGPLPN